MKVANSYASLLRGVSQQVPQDRVDGQHTEQVNFLSDPVNGLCRRHGSIWQAERQIADLSNEEWAQALAESRSYVTLPFDTVGKSYVIGYRKAGALTSIPFFYVYNKTDKVFLPVVRPVTDAGLDAVTGGISAATQVGKYLFFAGHVLPVSATSVDLWGSSPNNSRSVVWVRGGAFSRTFSVTARTAAGITYTFSHTTPPSSYQGTLNTADISVYEWEAGVTAHGKTLSDTGSIWSGGGVNWVLTVKADVNKLWLVLQDATAGEKQLANGTVLTHVSGATNTASFTATSPTSSSRDTYTKLVNDRVNAYNAAVTAWIGTSTAAIQPKAIVQGLSSAATTAGYTGCFIVNDATLALPNCLAVAVTDNGDNSLIRGVANEVESASAVSPVHYVDKVVKVRGEGSAEAYYLKAVPKDQATTGGLAEVTWVEGAGVQHTITGGLLYGTIAGGTFYYASSAAMLATLTSGPHPAIPASTVGDNDTSPLPFFVGQKISYLGTFQSRLLVGAGGVLALSKTEDYLNFFRSTVLTVPGDDPFEMLPQGSADDELRHGVLYDRDLVIFGKKRQYAISGQQALTPTSASMPVMSAYEDSADCAPAAAGGFIFYTKQADGATGVYQIQPGQTDNSPESFPASSQVATYIRGASTQLTVSTGSPSHLIVRTDGEPRGCYVFSYLDKQDGRKMDAWSRWEFAEDLGYLVGAHAVPTGILTFWLRRKPGTVSAYIVADLIPLKTELSQRPYLDSNRPWASLASGSLATSSTGQWAASYGAESTRRFIGSPLSTAGTLVASYGTSGLYAGALQSAYFIPTNPYMKDGKDKAILSGRLTVTKFVLAYKDSVGLKWDVTANGVTNTVEFTGRVLGDAGNIVGIEPISSGQITLPVGRETRQYSLKIAARDWHPLTVTALEYTGQFFNRVQRF